MKIELQKPYSEIWNRGYLVTNPENRKNVILYNSHSDRSTTSYARYLMSVHLGKIISDEYEIDHIDDDKTNDVIENLQILTKLENHHKQFKTGEITIQFICPICNSKFELTKRSAYKKVNPCCSKKCGGIKSHQTKKRIINVSESPS